MSVVQIDTQQLISTLKKPKIWTSIILGVLLVGGLIWWWTAREKRHRDAITSRDVLIEQLNNKWLACMNAPTDTTTHPITISLPPSGIFHPIPERTIKKVISKDTTNLSDTPKIANVLKLTDSSGTIRAYYNDTIKHQFVENKDTLSYSVNFEAMGYLKWIRILNISLDHHYMIVNKNHTITKYDTTFLPEKAPLFRIGIYGDMTLDNFKTFPGLGMGIQAIIKDRVTLGIGGLILDKVYGNIRIGWLPFKVK